MTIEEHIKYWLDSAEEDMESAFDIFNANRYNWCLFIGHLVLEKTLKAIYVKENENKVPPKIHDLLKLASKSNILLDIEKAKFFELVNRFCIAARYVEYKDELAQVATKEKTKEIINNIKEEFEWLKSLIKS